MYGNIKLIIKKITMWYILLFIIGGIIISYLTYKPKPKEKTFKEKFEEELIKRNYDIEFIGLDKDDSRECIFNTYYGKCTHWDTSGYIYNRYQSEYIEFQDTPTSFKEKIQAEYFKIKKQEKKKEELEKQLKEEEEYKQKYMGLLKITPLDKDLQDNFNKADKIIKLGKQVNDIIKEINNLRK